MSAVLNLTQHEATPDQIAAGVFDLPPEARAQLVALLTVEQLPTRSEIDNRCGSIAALANRFVVETDEDGQGYAHFAMIGGAPWMMASLEAFLLSAGIRPLYAFSRRESAEVAQPDGTVVKTNRFSHAGWIPAE